MGKKATDSNKTVVWATGALVAIVFFIVLTVFLASSKKNPSSSISPTPNPIEAIVQSSLPYPKVKVGTWIVQNAPVKTGTYAQVYTFKDSSPEKDAGKLAKRMVGTALINQGNGVYATYLTEPKSKDTSAFVYNTQKGEISYASTRGILTPSAEAFINALFYDPTIQITAHYKRKTRPGITYYEAHRDWSKVGLPILNPFGLVTLPENQRLSELSLNKHVPAIANPDIIQTSDQTDGLARQSDFNTITVGIHDNNHTVANMKSNIRPIQTNTLKVQSLLAYDEGLKKLKSNEYTVLYTAPTGQGIPQFNKVYPGNQAIMQRAVISESILAYLEGAPQTKQSILEPHYIFRGTGTLDSGYRVQFIAAVPARGISEVQGVSTIAQNFTPQQSTFFITGSPKAGSCGTALTCPPTPTVTPPINPHCGTSVTCPPTPTVTPHCGNGGPSCPPAPPQPTTPQPTEPPPFATLEVPTPTPSHCGNGGPACPPPPPQPSLTPTCEKLGNCPPPPNNPPPNNPPPNNPPANNPPPSGSMCDPRPEDLSDVHEVEPGVFVGKYQRGQQDPTWWYIPQGSSLDAESLLNLVQNHPELGSLRDKGLEGIQRDLERNPNCPVRLTGYSPTLFIYTNGNQTVSVMPKFTLTYTDSSLQNGAWTNFQKEYIYYEYKPVDFARPAKGWNIKKSDLDWFVKKLSSNLVLTPTETERLKFELSQSALAVNVNDLYVGLIPQSEIDSKLPLGLTAGTKSVRLHFAISAADHSVIAPTVNPISRTSPMIVELGAVAQ